ncbi:MAG: type II secretion system F family protein [Candidatus Omnitrophica bacterium]|nr:type II secretion system F family protein [Candidatus Omnitrophota bacterium]
MPKYILTMKDPSGNSLTKTVDAPDKNRAVSALQSEGFFVVGIQEVEDAASKAFGAKAQQARAGSRFTHNSVKIEDVLAFARQMATMLEAGVPLLRSVTVIGEQVESKELARILGEIRLEVEQGQTFSKALSKHPKAFSQFWVSLVEVGEASGTMPKVLEKLTVYMEESAAFQSHIIGALIYPGVLFSICLLAILFFALFVGPTFEKIFKDMGAQLPQITVVMLAIFKIIKTQFLIIIGVVVGIVFMIKRYINTEVGRWNSEMFMLNLPVFGPIVRLILVEKFTSQMAILVDSGVPILYALEIAEKLVDNRVCALEVRKIRDAVREGRLLADPMEKSGFFPSMAVQMIRVGEETGELSKMLNHVAVYYNKMVTDFMKRFGMLIEPFMLVFMGSIIGVIVIAMFMPMFSLAGGGG